MTSENTRNVTPPKYNENRPGTTGPAGGTQAKTRLIPARIISQETVIMTPEQFDNAAEALAVLLTRHWDDQPALSRHDLATAA